MDHSEKQLADKFRYGDSRAFEYIFKRFYKGLCAYSYTFLKDRDESEEIVQDFFTELWAQRKQLEIKISWKLYLYRGIHNKCINRLKSLAVMQRRHEKYVQYTLEEIELFDMDAESEEYEYFFSESFEKEVKNAINQLAPQQWQIFELSRFGQKTYAEIAAELNISVNTVKTQISRALLKLRNCLVEKTNYPLTFFFMQFNCDSTQ